MSLEVDISLELAGFDLRVAFAAEQGITALFGPSGAGKTMTLRCIAGLTRPTRGIIAVENDSVFDSDLDLDVPPRLRRVGYVFQQYALFPHLDVAANVAFGIRGLRPAERVARVRTLLDLVGLKDMANRRPHELSGGQQQRVALARALAPEPRLLLLDEPFAAVDLRLRRRLRAELRSIHEVTRTPMLLVTHDLAEVRALADSVVLLDGGRVIASGPTDRVFSLPLTPEVAVLMGDEPQAL